MRTASARIFGVGISALALLALSPARPLAAQSLEGSRWSIEEEGIDTAVVWWLGSEGRVRSGGLGMILPAYKWRQAGDSVFISIGDSVHYAAKLMSNRLVGGIRSARNHPEGWWSGARADATATTNVATTTGTASPPTSTPAGVQALSRPADSVSTPTPAPTANPPAGGRHPLRQIIRGDAGAAPAPQGATPAADGGHQMRRIERAGETSTATTSGAASSAPLNASLVGSWTRADSAGMIDGFDLAADGKATIHMRNGADGAADWTSDAQESHIAFHGAAGGEIQLVIWEGGPGLRGTVVTAAGPGRRLAFRRAGDGTTRQPAVRQP